jgi:hypothetical protein
MNRRKPVSGFLRLTRCWKATGQLIEFKRDALMMS